MATLSRITVYPVKSLDPVERERAAITGVGGLSGDREYVILDADGEYVNGKRTPAVHRLRADVDLDAEAVTLRRPGGEPRRFDLDERDDLEAWLADYFDLRVTVERTEGGGFTDSGAGSGPTLVSEATLEEVASWFPGLSAGDLHRRLRPNLVVGGVPAFWEDRLVADGGRRVRIGGASLDGEKPVPRCVVPVRDPETGEPYDGFRETFVGERERTLPEWADRDAFDHLYSLMVVTHAPERERGTVLRVGDPVEVAGERTEA